MKHSTYGASSASRWGKCAGSITLSQGIERRNSYAAAEGTAGHELGEECLRDGTEPVDFIGRIYEIEGFTIEVDLDLAEAVQCYVDYVREIPGTRLLETQINYSTLLGVEAEEGFGTGDCIVLDGTILHVIDAKFGRGYVNPYQNKQMILYGAGTVDALEAIGEEVTEIQLHVVQPRVSETPVPFIMSRIDLEVAVMELRKGAHLSEEARLTFSGTQDPVWVATYLNPGEDQCQWCPAAAICLALNAIASEFAPADAEEFEVATQLEKMTGKQLAAKQAMVPMVDIWSKAVEHETARRLTLDSTSVPGYKMVLGREGNRRWSDEAAAEEALAEFDKELTHKPAVLKSLPQIEKAFKKNEKVIAIIEELVVRNPAKPTLTTEDDSRTAWQEGSCADEFAVVPN